jgi:murein hydrolase activator
MQSTPDIKGYKDTHGRKWPRVVPVPRSVSWLSAGLLSLAGLSLAPAAAQVTAPAQQAATASPDIIRQREQEL